MRIFGPMPSSISTECLLMPEERRRPTSICRPKTMGGGIILATEREFLQEQKDNLLYKRFMVRATGRQNITTGVIDMSSLRLVELTPYDPSYNEQYLAKLIKRASHKWSDVADADQWLSEIRGTNG